MAEGMTFGMNITAHIKKSRPAEIKQALEQSINYGARLVQSKAKELVPVKTGKLRKSIAIRDISKGKGIGPDTDYDAYIEFGTLPHTIYPKNARVLHWVDSSGKDRFATKVRHPGTSAQPYMRPALDTSARKIIMFLQKQVRKALS